MSSSTTIICRATRSLAEFDATILRSGRPIAPVAPEWRPFASALAPAFMVPVAHAAGFVSAYPASDYAALLNFAQIDQFSVDESYAETADSMFRIDAVAGSGDSAVACRSPLISTEVTYPAP